MAASTLGPVPRYSVDGLGTLLRETRKFEPQLVRDTQKQMRDQLGGPLRKTAGQLVQNSLYRYGDRPASGWNKTGRLGWKTNTVINGFKVSAARSYQKRTHTWAVATFFQKNPAGAMFDWAGRSGEYVGKGRPGNQRTLSVQGNRRRGIAFVNNMQAAIRFGSIKGSKYSRTVFPAIVQNRPVMVRELALIVQDLEREVTRKIGGN